MRHTTYNIIVNYLNYRNSVIINTLQKNIHMSDLCVRQIRIT